MDSDLQQYGYRLFPKVFAPIFVERLRSEVEALDREVARKPNTGHSQLLVVPEAKNKNLVSRYEHLIAASPCLREILDHVLDPMLKDLYGESMQLFKDKLNSKPPGGGGYGPHQDIVAYKAFPPRYHLTAMFTIDSATNENGCLQIAEDYKSVAACSSDFIDEFFGELPVFKYQWGVGNGNGDIVPELSRRFTWRPLTTSPNDLLIFDSFVPHWSGPNCSTETRRLMFITFSPSKYGSFYEHYYAEKLLNPLDPKFHVSTPTFFKYDS